MSSGVKFVHSKTSCVPLSNPNQSSNKAVSCSMRLLTFLVDRATHHRVHVSNSDSCLLYSMVRG